MLVLPDAEPVVGSWRNHHDWTASLGVPAHVTVRLPFAPPERWGDRAARALLASLLPIEVTLARLEDRAGALVVLVEPDDELRRVTAAVGEAWPELPPHKERWGAFAYHVTVVRTPDPAVRTAAAAAIAPRLPLRVVGTEFRAAQGSRETWVEHVRLAAVPIGDRREGAPR